jgi:hypothetical protein
MTIKELAKVFCHEQTLFQLVDVLSGEELGSYSPNLITLGKWTEDDTKLFEQDVANVYIERVTPTQSTLRVDMYDRRG